jgi:hypothetical protein
MKKITLAFVTIISIVMISCNFSSTNFNEESEKIAAEKVADELYVHLKNKNFGEADKLFSGEFFAISNKDTLHMMFEKTEKILGVFKSKKMKEWSSTRLFGGDGGELSKCILVYDVTYENYPAVETIVVVRKNETDKAKILGYHVNSKGFLK